MGRWGVRGRARTGHGMARTRELDETAVLDAAAQCFWARGYEATSVRDLIEKTGITGASLYNAFGDKRSLYQKALDHYVDQSVARSEEHTSELQSPHHLVCRLLLEKKKKLPNNLDIA